MSRLPASSRLGFSMLIATRLLPASSGAEALVPSADGAADDAVAVMATQAARAGRQAMRLAERAAAAAQERRPEAEQRAKEAAALAGAHAVRLARCAATLADRAAAGARSRLGDASRRAAFLSAYRRRLQLGAAALFAVTVATLAVGGLGGGGATQAQVEAALDLFGLRPVLRYRDMSTSLLGTVTLSGVAMEIGGLIVTADALRVERIGMDGGAPRAVRLAVDHAQLPVLEAARRGGSPLLRDAVGLGYTTLRADLTLDLTIDDRARVLAIRVGGSADAVGSFTGNVSLGGITSAAVAEAFRTLARVQDQGQDSWLGGGGAGAREPAASFLTALSLRDATLTLDDDKLFARMAEIPASGVPEPTDETDARTSPPELEQHLAASFRLEERAAAMRTLRRWLDRGGSLTMSLSPVAPLPLFREDRAGWITPSLGDRDFLARAGLSILG